MDNEIVRSVLITNHHLADFAGSEINAYTLAKYFKDNGTDVVVGTLWHGEPIGGLFRQAGIKVINMLEDEFPTRQFDLVWAHHAPTLYNCIFEHGVQFQRAIFSSLSPYEPLEALPVFADKLTCVLANSNETKDKLVQEMPGLSNLRLFPNYATDDFFSPSYKLEWELKRVAIISNHVATELLEFKDCMVNEHYVAVDIIGLEFEVRFVDAALLREYDLIIAIGKTVQYAMAAGVPIYCYDHFGGPGWLNENNISTAEYHNFSGRGFNRKLNAEELVKDIWGKGYRNNLANLNFLRSYACHKFRFISNITSLLAWLTQQPSIDMKLFAQFGYLQRQNKYYTRRLTQSNYIYSKLYVDFGNGFSEKESFVSVFQMAGDNFSLHFVIDQQHEELMTIKSLRWDPVDAGFCRCKIDAILVDGKLCQIKCANNWRVKDGYYEFLTIDPAFLIEGNFSVAKEVSINGSLIIAESNNISYFIRELKQALESSENEKELLQQSVAEIIAEYDKISYSTRELKQALESSENEKELLQQSVAEYTAWAVAIKRSSSWRLTAPLRFFGHLLKRIFFHGRAHR